MHELAAQGFSLDPLTDLQDLLSTPFVRSALLVGTMAAVVSGVVGYFVVIRGLTFAADALTHVGFTGASGAVLLGASPVAGLVTLTAAVAVGIGLLEQRLRSRDVVIGLVLVEALGLGVLFLSLAATSNSNETYALLFGNIFLHSGSDIVLLMICTAVAAAGVVTLFRPLLLASLDDEVAAARGISLRGIGIGFLVILALTVAAVSQVVGALLAVALIVGPAAAAQALTNRPGRVIGFAVGIGLLSVWLGVALAWWLPYPASFFITSLVGGIYAVARMAAWLRVRRHNAVVATPLAAAGEAP